MEAIADLIPFAIVAGFWLLRAIRGAKNRAQPPAQASPSASEASAGEPSAPTPFEQLMRQLEQALEDPTAEAEREPEPARPAELQAKRPPAPRAAPRPPRAVPTAFDKPSAFETFDEQAAFDHDEHGFGLDNPASEEAFEARPAFSTRRRPVAPDYDPHALRSGRSQPQSRPKTSSKSQPLGPLQVQSTKPLRRGASAWAERLHDPAAAREALVLKTIFEGPWKPRSGRKER